MVIILGVVAAVFDMSQKLEDFLRSDLGFFGILQAYVQHFMLYILNLLSPFIVFLSAIWVTTRLATRTETTAILAGGVSFNRFLRPYLMVGVLLVIVLMWMSHFVVPRSNYQRLEFENKYTNYNAIIKHNYLELEKGTIVYYKSFEIRSNTVTRMTVQKWKKEGGKNIKTWELQAAGAEGDSTTKNWSLTKVFIRDIGPDGEKIRTLPELDTTFNFKGTDLGQRAVIAQAMDTPTLTEYREKEEAKGSGNVPFIEVERYLRTATPLSIFILIILAVCVSYKKKRSGMGINLAVGFGVGASYVFTTRMATVAATKSGLDPLLAVWIPNIIFGVLTLIIYLRARK